LQQPPGGRAEQLRGAGVRPFEIHHPDHSEVVCAPDDEVSEAEIVTNELVGARRVARFDKLRGDGLECAKGSVFGLGDGGTAT